MGLIEAAAIGEALSGAFTEYLSTGLRDNKFSQWVLWNHSCGWSPDYLPLHFMTFTRRSKYIVDSAKSVA